MKNKDETKEKSENRLAAALPYPTGNNEIPLARQELSSLLCPNCGSRLEGRKCKLLCLTPGCGYMVTCSEW